MRSPSSRPSLEVDQPERFTAMPAKKKATAKKKVAAKKAAPRKAVKKSAAKKSPKKKAAKPAKESRRLWLTYPSKMIERPLIWELGEKFDLVTNVRQASVSDVIGIVCLELEGDRASVKKGIAWLEKNGVTVDPVECSVIEG